MEKQIFLFNQDQDNTDKLFYNIFAYILLSSGINNLLDYSNTESKRYLITGIVYVFIALLGFLRFNKLWFYKRPTYIKFTDDLIELRLKPYARPVLVKWADIKSVSINDLEFALHNTSDSTTFNLEWIPTKIANQVKFEFLQRVKDKGIEVVG